jgi:RND family efflux transporter MFP subunit
MKRILIIAIILIAFISSCKRGSKQAPANMEELHRTQGVPVRVKLIEPEVFIQELDYNVTVSGLREAPVSARISDTIESVHARIGQMVSRDQVIIRFPQNNPQASFYQAKAAYDLAEQTWTRMQGLFASGGISQQDLDGAETQFKVAQANWDAVQQSVHVRAPISGMITDINVRANQRVNPGDYLFTVSQLNKLFGKVWISERDINSVPKNADVIFTWNDIEKKARVTNLALSLNRDHNAFAADIEIENSDYAIRSGVTGKAIIVLYRNENAIVVPRNIVMSEGDENFVYLSVDGYAQKRIVTIGRESEISYEIVDGLSFDEILIVQGLQLISDGAKINVRF